MKRNGKIICNYYIKIRLGVILSVVLSLGGIWSFPSKIIRKMSVIEQGVKSNNKKTEYK
ncbi:MAG: hypothetical protein LBM02_05635 [Lachnospiraceae bacterium]|nr:hypothetical protein [Lachnospiraceae bacterium]